MDVESDEAAFDITGEEISEGQVGTESSSFNAYGSPVARRQNVNVNVTEPRSAVNHVVRNSYFAFVARVCSCILVSFCFNFQLKLTRLNICGFATVKQHVAERELRGLQAALVGTLSRTDVQLIVRVGRGKRVKIGPLRSSPLIETPVHMPAIREL